MAWDPSNMLVQPNRTGSGLSPLCLVRIRRDLKSIVLEPPPGIFVVADESNITLVHALIIGPPDTPYEKGFFYFIVGFPSDYPISPPKVRLMTTGGSGARFNPNLYSDGKVCLSILGTWSGPSWSPAHSLTSVLLSIQSLLNDKPYHNEPGYEREVQLGDVQLYNDVVQHETLRVAVVGMLDNDFGVMSIPPSLVVVMQNQFLQSYEFYVTVIKSKLYLDNKMMNDPFRTNRGQFIFSSILVRLQSIYYRLKNANSTDNSSSNSSAVTM